MADRKIHWALVGIGDIARKRVGPAIRAQADSVLYACVTRDREARADDLAKLGPERVYTSFEAMLDDPQVDAVYLATPVFLHAPQALAGLRAGKHVLVEKPMALNSTEADLMCRAAQAAERSLAVAYYRRFWPRFQAVRDLLEGGTLGAVVLVRLALHQWYAPAAGAPGAWRTQPEQAGGGVLFDVGCHRLDLAAWWLGLPQRVVATVATQTHAYPAEDSATVLLAWPSGATGTCSCHWNSRAWADEIHVLGTEGQVSLAPCDGDEIVISHGRECERRAVPRPDNAHLPLVDDFARSIIEGRRPRFHGGDGILATRVLDAIVESARKGAWVEVR